MKTVKHVILILAIVLTAHTAQGGIDLAMTGIRRLTEEYLEFAKRDYHTVEDMAEFEYKFKQLCVNHELQDKIYQQVVIINMFLKKRRREFVEQHIKRLERQLDTIKNGATTYSRSLPEKGL